MSELVLLSLINTLIVAIVVLIHFEALSLMTQWLPKIGVRGRLQIVVGVAGALLAHILEIWVFAFAFYVKVHYLEWGSFGGSFNGTLLDCYYFAFTTYTTLGFGDIHPYGAVRYLTGIESLTGLVLITWTASFLYLQMQRHWKES